MGEQSVMTATRPTIGELGNVPRALSAAHVAVAKHLEASRPAPLGEPTAAAEGATFLVEDQRLLPQLEGIWPNGRPPTA